MVLPVVIVLYLLPTIAIFIPGLSIISLQSILAFWQVTPVLVNVPFWITSFFVPSEPAAGKTKTADIPHLKILYNTLLLINIVTHWITIYKVASSETAGVTFQRVFLPDLAFWKT